MSRLSVGRAGLEGRNIRDMKINCFKNVNVVHADSMLISKVSCDEFRSRDSSVGMATDIGSRDSSVGIATDIGSRDS